MSFYLLDRVVKSAIHSQSSNLSPSAIVRTSRCIGSLFNVAEQFDKLSLLHPQSSSHSEAKLDQDISVSSNYTKLLKCFTIYPQEDMNI